MPNIKTMAFILKQIVPWGRSFNEYVKMFALSEQDLKKRFIGCGDGPASFNSVLTQRGGVVISVDPIYQFSGNEIKKKINETYDEIIEQTRKNKDEFVWKHISSVEELGRIRLEAMHIFLSDYENGLKEKRYVNATLPMLPFCDKEFDIALCSHFLFLYSEQLDMDFHIKSIRELCRVANEVRVFPLLELGAKKSRHIESVMNALRNDGVEVRVQKVPYEFQKGGNEMLRITNT